MLFDTPLLSEHFNLLVNQYNVNENWLTNKTYVDLITHTPFTFKENDTEVDAKVFFVKFINECEDIKTKYEYAVVKTFIYAITHDKQRYISDGIVKSKCEDSSLYY